MLEQDNRRNAGQDGNGQSVKRAPGSQITHDDSGQVAVAQEWEGEEKVRPRSGPPGSSACLVQVKELWPWGASPKKERLISRQQDLPSPTLFILTRLPPLLCLTDSSCFSSPLSDWSFEELKTTKVTVWHGVANRVSRTAQIGDDATEAEESRKEMAERIGTGHKEGRKEQPPSSFYRVKRI